jgi:tetratricopeptide (TPR) repeat protein
VRRSTGRRRFFVPALLALCLLGCASTQARNVRLDVPPITIVGNPHPNEPGFYDAYDLFEQGDRAYVAAQWETAEALYVKLLHEYPGSEIAAMARYNLGLALEHRQLWERALAVYREFPNPPGRGVRLEEVRLRQSVCLTRLGRYDEARAQLEAILVQFGVPPLEANEARARLGIVWYRLGDEIMAEYYLRPALATYQENVQRGLLQYRAAFGEGFFVLGEIAFRHFQELKIEGEGPQLEESLRAKAAALFAARAHYENAIRTYEPEWIIAALFRIGMCYELMYDAILAAPEPTELTPAELAEYRQKLRAKIQPLFDKTLTVYRRCLEFAVQLNVTGDWVTQTKQRYEALLQRGRRGV